MIDVLERMKKVILGGGEIKKEKKKNLTGTESEKLVLFIRGKKNL